MGGGTRVWGMGQLGAAAERQGGRALVRRRGTAATSTVKGMRGVGILSVRRRWGGELDREGAGRGHTKRMGVPAHGAYVRLGSWAVT
jgi:hypothetical protein